MPYTPDGATGNKKKIWIHQCFNKFKLWSLNCIHTHTHTHTNEHAFVCREWEHLNDATVVADRGPGVWVYSTGLSFREFWDWFSGRSVSKIFCLQTETFTSITDKTWGMLGSQGPTPQFTASDPSVNQRLHAHPVIRVRECVPWVPPQKWIPCTWLSRLGTDRPTETMPGDTKSSQPTAVAASLGQKGKCYW
jgi:hypothetical protein